MRWQTCVELRRYASDIALSRDGKLKRGESKGLNCPVSCLESPSRVFLYAINQQVFMQASIGVIEAVFEFLQERNVFPDSLLDIPPQPSVQNLPPGVHRVAAFQRTQRLGWRED